MRTHLLLVTATMLVMVSVPVRAATVTIAGSTTFNNAVMVPYQRAIEAATGDTLVILPNRTELGVRLLLEHSADLAMISSKLEIVEKTLKETDPSLPVERLKGFVAYRARVAFTVHPSNPIRSINTAELKGILLGQIINWSELGGPDRPIKLVMVDGGAGIPLTVSTQLLGGKPITETNTIRVRISSQVAKIVAQEPGALGLTQAKNIPGNNIKEIATEDTIEQELSYVTLDEPSPTLKSVIDVTRKILDAE
jgi:ABC-type phosphate transport system substrate-binding protein